LPADDRSGRFDIAMMDFWQQISLLLSVSRRDSTKEMRPPDSFFAGCPVGRKHIKRRTIEQRRRQHFKAAA
jgi:hypothetical protein